MKKVSVSLTSAACLIAVGSAFAFANPFAVFKSYRVDPVSGAPVIPYQEVGKHFCATSTQKCKVTYEIDAQGNPIVSTGVLSSGTYTAIP